jgi:preprotein translocase subunit SecD
MTPIQQISLWLTIVISISTIISVVSLGVRWLVKHYLQEIKSQLHTNGGSSIKDQVNRLESRQDKDETLGKETYKKVEKLEVKIDDLYDKLISFLSRNN